MSLYTDLELKTKIKNQLHESRKELGSFCGQYGHHTLVTHQESINKSGNKKQKLNIIFIKKTFIQEKMIK